jgi:predicted NBD/HSP70 family sugar kinase
MIGAVDIGGTKLAVGMVTESGQVLSRKESPTDAGRYVNGLARLLACCERRHKLPVLKSPA